jgi:hypothetical protein
MNANDWERRVDREFSYLRTGFAGELSRKDFARIPSAFTRIYGRVAS